MAKPILCLDFDGVIHSYLSGWQGAAVVSDAPVPGAMRFIWDASEHFRVAIYSSRSGQRGGTRAMKSWLTKHFREHWSGDRTACDDKLAEIEWPKEKPAAFVTIDDRALTFDGSWPSLESLRRFQPWNKRDQIGGDEFPVTIDRENGVITICGIRYSFDVLRFLGFAALGKSYRLIDRKDGVVTVEYLDGADPLS